MDKTKPTRGRPRVPDEQRAAEADELAAKMAEAIKAARASDPRAAREAWAEVATYAGNVQRRARLLAGLGRGG